MKKQFIFLLSIFLISSVLASCNKDKNLNISLDNSEPLALAVDVEWAVVTDSYVTFRSDKDWNSSDKGHAKKGAVLKVIGYSYSKENEKWVKFEEGYLPIKSVIVYSNKYQAVSEARKLEEK